MAENEPIPDLWELNEDARRLYDSYLSRLRIAGRHQRVVTVCRQIQEYAARGPGEEHALFVRSPLIDAFCELNNFEQAWQVLRWFQQIAFGAPIDLHRHEWTPQSAAEIEHHLAPLLYFRGRYRDGCMLLETLLGFWFDDHKVRSYVLLGRIYNGDKEPTNRYRVTLSHFYRRLGKSLSEWPHWETFVNGFHPRLFRLAEMKREELLTNSEQLPAFVDRLMDIRDERTTSGVGGSLSDLIDSPAKVRKRQEATQRKLDEFHEWSKPRQDALTAKLWELFPELQKHSLLG